MRAAKMWTDFYCIALIRANVIARVSRQYTPGYVHWLVIAQYGAGKAAALHLCKLVNQHVTCSHNLALETQPAAE